MIKLIDFTCLKLGMYNPFFEIPIYRLSFDDRVIETEKEKEKYFQMFKKNDHLNYWTREKTDKYYENERWKGRHYNEIIGYIEVFVDGRKIHGDLYWITAKKIRRNLKNKTLKYLGKTFETWIHDDKMNNQEILEQIISTINIEGKNYLKKRFLDISKFQKSGEYIDWRTLCGLNK